MKVYVPGPLRSYTGNRSMVEARGATLGETLADLDRQFPGMRFRMIDEQDRIREHIRFFVNQELAAGLGMPLREGDELQIVCAISGGVGAGDCDLSNGWGTATVQAGGGCFTTFYRFCR